MTKILLFVLRLVVFTLQVLVGAVLGFLGGIGCCMFVAAWWLSSSWRWLCRS
jgi:hypothetical protein